MRADALLPAELLVVVASDGPPPRLPREGASASSSSMRITAGAHARAAAKTPCSPQRAALTACLDAAHTSVHVHRCVPLPYVKLRCHSPSQD